MTRIPRFFLEHEIILFRLPCRGHHKRPVFAEGWVQCGTHVSQDVRKQLLYRWVLLVAGQVNGTGLDQQSL